MFGRFVFLALSLFVFATSAFASILTLPKVTGLTYTVKTADGVVVNDGDDLAAGTVLKIYPTVQRNDEGVYYLDKVYHVYKGSTNYDLNAQTSKKTEGDVTYYQFTLVEYDTRIRFDCWKLYHIDYSVTGGGSVKISNTARDTYKGKNYYVTGTTYFDVLSIDEGYYLSSAFIRGRNTKATLYVDGKTGMATRFYFEGQAADYTADITFKKLDLSIVNNVADFCDVQDLPATAQHGEKVQFSFKCKEGYGMSPSLSFADSNDAYARGLSVVAGDYGYASEGSYEFVKGYSKVSLSGNFRYGYKLDVADTSIAKFSKKDQFLYAEDYVNVYIKAFDGGVVDSVFYSYVENGEEKVGKAATRDYPYDGYTSIATVIMPAAPVKVKLHRVYEENEIVSDVDDRCSVMDLPEKAKVGDEIKFKVECAEGYSMTPEFKGCVDETSCFDIENVDGVYHFDMPAAEVHLKGGRVMYAVTLNGETADYAVYENPDFEGPSVKADFATEGSGVLVTVENKAGSEIRAVTCSYFDGINDLHIVLTLSECEDGDCMEGRFKMPRYPVVIDVERRKIDDVTGFVYSALPQFNLNMNGRTLKLDGVRVGSLMTVYSMQGRMLKTIRLEKSDAAVELPYAGRFLVKVDGAILPITVR